MFRNCPLFKSFYRSQFTFMYHEKSIFRASQPVQYSLFHILLVKTNYEDFFEFERN